MRALLDLEDAAPDALFERISGIDVPLWPLARWPVSRALAETDIGTRLPPPRQTSLRQRLMTTARRTVPNPSSAHRAPRAEHLFIVSGWTRNPGPGGFCNWLSDDFAGALGANAIVVQDAYVDRLSREDARPRNPRTYTYARASERATRATHSRPLPAQERRRLEAALRATFAVLDHPVTDAGRERAIADALGRADRAPHAQREFGRLLDRVQPRRIYMQTAAYGTRASEIMLSRERGIEVAELQHGWVGSSHAAYNVGAAMRTPDLEKCLPDTILGYGEIWGRELRFPARFVPLGKPSLDPATLASTPWNGRPKRALFVSSNFEHDLVDRTLIALHESLPDDWTVALRPHPVERATAAQRHAAALRLPRVELDVTADAGAALASSRAIVGFSSTMLFEALAYGCHVAVVDSVLAEHYANESVFPLRIASDLSNVADAAVRIQTEPDAVEAAITESVWKSGAVESFREFAAS
ncbi:hypothetical protein [Microbacterium sp. NPDC055357]